MYLLNLRSLTCAQARTCRAPARCEPAEALPRERHPLVRRVVVQQLVPLVVPVVAPQLSLPQGTRIDASFLLAFCAVYLAGLALWSKQGGFMTSPYSRHAAVTLCMLKQTCHVLTYMCRL